PISVINARISERSFRGYRRLPRALRWLLPAAAAICAQDEASATRLAELGVPADRLRMTGNLKFDNIPTRVAGMREKLGIATDEWVLVGASTHEGEEAVVLAAFHMARAARPDLRLILAPRHPRRRAEVEAAIRAAGLAFATRSAGAEPDPALPVYLADTLGEMDRWYAGAGMTFVGGSLVDRGGHTPFEPAAHGSAILTGPHVANAVPAYAALLAAGGAVEVTDAASLAEAILRLAGPQAQARQAEAATRALAPFTAGPAIAAFLVALSRETGLPLKGAADAVQP
ncbi:MAG: 3-deoxy-D-manno-octulosonic acid transferase, partial [Albidovulum sp.]|uniref:3-deoxy-D-manno-octulosonic acid transferase n=1 Tax=Albidovulum sp. TaxID=1872424 RepID=UPI00132A7A0B